MRFLRSSLAGAGGTGALVLLLPFLASPFDPPAPDFPPLWLTGSAAAVAAGALLLRNRLVRRADAWDAGAIVAALAVLGSAVAQWFDVARAVQAELPPGHVGDILFFLGLVLVGTATPAFVVVSRIVDHREGAKDLPHRRAPVAVGAGALAAAVLVAAGVVPVAAVVPLPPVPGRIGAADSVVVEAGGDPAPVPSAVTGTAWTWSTPQGTSLRAAHAAGPGVLAELDDGVVMLDGSTGGDLWSYRRPGGDTYFHEASVSPDGRTALLRYSLDSSALADAFPGFLVVSLDTLTGEPHFETMSPDSWTGPEPTVADDTFVTWSRTSVRGFDLRTGLPVWSRDLPSDCVPPNEDAYGMPEYAVAVPGAVVGALWCGDVDNLSRARWKESGQDVAVSLLALDSASGDELWRYDQDVSAAERAPSVALHAAWDASLVGLRVGYRYGTDGTKGILTLAHTVVLTPQAGEPLVSRTEPECAYGGPGIVVGSSSAAASRHLSAEPAPEDGCGDHRDLVYRVNGVDAEPGPDLVPPREGEGWTVPGRSSGEQLLVLEEALLVFSGRYHRRTDEIPTITRVGYSIVPVPHGTGDPGRALTGEVPVGEDDSRLSDSDELAPFVPAPGVVAVAIPGTTEVHGLA